jgi:hypothetical protein
MRGEREDDSKKIYRKLYVTAGECLFELTKKLQEWIEKFSVKKFDIRCVISCSGSCVIIALLLRLQNSWVGRALE